MAPASTSNEFITLDLATGSSTFTPEAPSVLCSTVAEQPAPARPTAPTRSSSLAELPQPVVEFRAPSLLAPPSPPPPAYPSSRRSSLAVTGDAQAGPTVLDFFPASSSGRAGEDLPSYRSVPYTKAERFFWLGFFFPLFWILSISHFWRPERPLRSSSKANSSNGRVSNELLPSYDAFMLAEEGASRWREEERLWARRSAYFLTGLAFLVGVVTVIVLNSARVFS